MFVCHPHVCVAEQGVRPRGYESFEPVEALCVLTGVIQGLVRRYAACAVGASGECETRSTWERIGGAVVAGMFQRAQGCSCEETLLEGSDMKPCEGCKEERKVRWLAMPTRR
jgi:hypothetical protein